jgi:hypothetical protein
MGQQVRRIPLSYSYETRSPVPTLATLPAMKSKGTGNTKVLSCLSLAGATVIPNPSKLALPGNPYEVGASGAK